jgi:hypothetical protein
MSIVTAIEKMAAKHRDRQKVQGTDYPSIVRQVADGLKPDPEIVERVLFEAGKSFDDLKAAAELYERRRQWRVQYDALPEITAEHERVENQIAAANKILEAAEKRHYDEVMPLMGDLTTLKESMRECDNAQTQLWETCSNPELVGQMNEVIARTQRAMREASDLIDTARQWGDRVKSERAAAEAAKMIIGGDQEVKDRLARVKEQKRRAAECEAQHAKVQKTVAELQHREQQIHELMLEP